MWVESGSINLYLEHYSESFLSTLAWHGFQGRRRRRWSDALLPELRQEIYFHASPGAQILQTEDEHAYRFVSAISHMHRIFRIPHVKCMLLKKMFCPKNATGTYSFLWKYRFRNLNGCFGYGNYHAPYSLKSTEFMNSVSS